MYVNYKFADYYKTLLKLRVRYHILNTRKISCGFGIIKLSRGILEPHLVALWYVHCSKSHNLSSRIIKDL